jgi:HK97 family phage prohead protease
MTAASLLVAESGAPDGTIRGYASLFGVADLVGDRIEPGAFRASLARRGPRRVRMLWQHDPARPIGVWTRLGEDRTGLFAEGRLALDTQGGREAFVLIAAGALDGLSIGFRTQRAVRERGRPGRRLAEIDLWEISVVTFPMQDGARLDLRADGPAVTAFAGRLRTAAGRLAAGPAGALAGCRRGVQAALDRLSRP